MNSYTYNSSNELISNSAATFTYDANGNTLTKTNGSGTTQYAWDFENRLTSAVIPGVGTVTFRYDPFGRRIQKAGSNGTINFLYDGADAIEELDSSGNLLARYAQGAGIDEPLSELRGATGVYYQQDDLGSVTSLSNSMAALLNTYTYDAFGNIAASSGSFLNPYLYTGRDYDSETGLRYYRTRYYLPDVGRFLSEDRIGFKGSSNFYTYVDNEPPNFVDPWGEQIAVKGDTASYQTAIQYLKTSPFAAALIEELQSSPELYVVVVSTDVTADTAPGNTVFWNPFAALCVKDGVQSPALGGLLHELVHIWQHKHKLKHTYHFDPQKHWVDVLEEQAVQTTNRVAPQLREPLRHGYYDFGNNPNVATPIQRSPTDCPCKLHHD